MEEEEEEGEHTTEQLSWKFMQSPWAQDPKKRQLRKIHRPWHSQGEAAQATSITSKHNLLPSHFPSD
jgi:hypothetical protein